MPDLTFDTSDNVAIALTRKGLYVLGLVTSLVVDSHVPTGKELTDAERDHLEVAAYANGASIRFE